MHTTNTDLQLPVLDIGWGTSASLSTPSRVAELLGAWWGWEKMVPGNVILTAANTTSTKSKTKSNQQASGVWSTTFLG